MIATYLDRRFSLPLLEFFCCLAAYLFIINLLCPTIGEDFVLTAVPPHESTASFPDFWSRVFDRIRMQAEGWNARIGEQAYKKRGGGQTDNYIRLLSFYILALVIIILFLPRLGEVLFWRTGVTNYWWAAGLLLLAGLPLREYVGHERIERLENTRWKIIIFAMLSFAAGFTNENNVCVFLFLYFCTIAYDLVKYRRIKAWTIINTVSMGLGYFILLTCRSTRHRIEYYNSVYGVHGTFLENAVRRIPDVIGAYFQVSCLILILQALAFIIFITA